MPPRAGIVFRTIIPILTNFTAFVALPFGIPIAISGGFSALKREDIDVLMNAVKIATLSALGAWTFLNAVSEMSYPTRRNVLFANLAWVVVVGMCLFAWVRYVTNC